MTSNATLTRPRQGADLTSKRLVRMWFGRQIVVSFQGGPADAAGYERAMRRRFAAGRVTNEPVSDR